MKIFTLSGWTNDTGLWEVEVFTTKEEALEQFNFYVSEYNAEVDGYDAICSEGTFHLEEHEI